MSAVDAIDPSRGATVLIVGATGGVGTFAIQLAAARGASVIATIKPGDEDVVTGLGAAETVDYSNDVIGAVRERHPDGIDSVIDLVNRDPDGFGALAGLVRIGGRAVSALGGAGEATQIGGIDVRNIGSDPSHLGRLASLIEEGKLTVAIKRTYALSDAAIALTDFANQHTVGKLVITMPGVGPRGLRGRGVRRPGRRRGRTRKRAASRRPAALADPPGVVPLRGTTPRS